MRAATSSRLARVAPLAPKVALSLEEGNWSRYGHLVLLTTVVVVDRIQGLADELVALGRFANAWLFGRKVVPLPAWELTALPGPLAVEVRDETGQQVLWNGVEAVELQHAGAYRLPPPDAAGVGLGDPFQWADAVPMNSRPGGRYPGSTDLLARYRARPEVALLFSMQRPVTEGVASWIGPGDPETPGAVARSLSYPGRHRSRAHEAVYGGRQWGAIAVAARGLPQLRALQVSVHEHWISPAEGQLGLEGELRRLRFWTSKGDNRRFWRAEDVEEIAAAGADELVRQAVNGTHTPAYPLGRPYLRLVVLSKMNAISAAWSPLARPPVDWPTSDRNLRRIELQLARERSVPSLTLLGEDERTLLGEEAREILAERARLRALRASFVEFARSRGVAVSEEALRQFVARHRTDDDELLNFAMRHYVWEHEPGRRKRR